MSFLWASRATGVPSSSKLWRQVAYVLASYVIYVNARGIDPMLLLVFLAVVSGSEIAQKALDMKLGGSKKESADA